MRLIVWLVYKFCTLCSFSRFLQLRHCATFLYTVSILTKKGMMWSFVITALILCITGIQAVSVILRQFEADCFAKCTSGQSCSLPYPHDCQKYISCQLTDQNGYDPIEQMCAFGTFLNPSSGNCDHSKEVNCQYDRCKDKHNGYTYKNTAGCRSFWQCENGVSVPQCCEENKRWDNSICVLDDPLRPECPEASDRDCLFYAPCKQNTRINCREYYKCINGTYFHRCCKQGEKFNAIDRMCDADVVGTSCNKECPSSVTNNCYLHAVPGDKYSYTNEYSATPELKQRCANGAMFDEATCSCPHDPDYNSNRCEPWFDLSNPHSRDYLRKNMPIGENAAVFGRNDSKIVIHSFERGIEASSMFLQMKFTPGQASRPQVLVSSCSQSNPLQILLDSTRGNKVIITVESLEIRLDYIPGRKNELTFDFKEGEVIVTNHVESPNNENWKDQVTLDTKKMSQWSTPMFIGRCPDDTNGSPYDGTIDLLKIYINCKNN